MSAADIAMSVRSAWRCRGRPGERGGVVDAVADHGDDPALGLQPLDDVDLLGGQRVGDDGGDADGVGHGVCGALPIAGEQDRLHVSRRSAATAAAIAAVGVGDSATALSRPQASSTAV